MLDYEYEEFDAISLTKRMDMIHRLNDEHEATYKQVKAKTDLIDKYLNRLPYGQMDEVHSNRD